MYCSEEERPESIKTIITNHKKDIFGNFEMIALLVGLQGENTKYSRFLC